MQDSSCVLYSLRLAETSKTPDQNAPRGSVLEVFEMIDPGLVGVPREQKMIKGHLPRVIYHRVY